MAAIIRTMEDGDVEAAAHCQGASFGFDATPDGIASRRSILEVARSHVAVDDAQIVGTAGIYSYQMAVPGLRTVPAAGVTMVSVMPTHRRQGILTNLMRTQLDHVREHGDPVAALWASESGIYGRFGYGMAAETVDIRIDRVRTAFTNPVEAAGSLRYLAQDEAREGWPAFHELIQVRTPGMMHRSPAWWGRVFRDPPEMRGGFTSQQYVNYEVNGTIQGYLRYRRKMDWPDGLPGGTTKVEELFALTNEAYAALWQYAFGLDLMSTIVADHRPVDEPLSWMLADPRRLHRYATDSLWLRMVDIARCLASRTYAIEGTLILDVRDEFLDGVGGRFVLNGGPDGATCTRSDRNADIELSIADLGAVYLGAARFTTLARAGRVRGDSATLLRADAVFLSPTAPWCPETF